MESFQFNKYAMALLGTVFIVMSLGIVSEGIYHAEVPEEQSYVIAEGGAPEATGGEEAGPAFEPVAPLMASADAAAGEAVFKKCQSCHTLEQGGANKVGPNLYGIIGRPIASHEGFSYSSALQEYGQGKDWTYEDLNGFFWKPKTYVKGTAMGFVGLKDVEDRANVIAYLRTFADTPAPLPEPEAASAEPEEAAAPAEESASGTTEETAAETEEAEPAANEASGSQEAPATEEAAPASESTGEEAPASTTEPSSETTEQPAEGTQ